MFSRSHPSPRYRELQALYGQLHREGERTLGVSPEDTFPGKSLFPHVGRIKRLVQASGARTILDYGSGKGLQYRPQPVVVDGVEVAASIPEYWGAEVRCYDPGYAPHAALPSGEFDGVICTDVLEHCPESDLPWILDEIFSYARRFVFLNVACFPARKSLPNGENAHITVRAPAWWRELVAQRAASRPGVQWELTAAQLVDGRVSEAVFGSAAGGAEPRRADAVELSEIEIEGLKARFLTPNEMTRWRARSLYTKEPCTIEWLRAMPRGAVLLDVGANVGMYTVFAALARDAKVYAFEPESQNYATLSANLMLNGLAERVLALCAGLSDKAGIDRLYLAANHVGASCHSLGAQVGFDLQPRPASFVQGTIAMRLDDLVAAGEIPVPGYVKIDVDGFEHKVVAGARRTLARPEVKSLCIEINHNLEEHLDLVDELGRLGFRHDPGQVARAERKSGAFQGVAEYVFAR